MAFSENICTLTKTIDLRGGFGLVKIRHFVVDVDEFMVLCNDSVLVERIVINSSVQSVFWKNIDNYAAEEMYFLEKKLHIFLIDQLINLS